MRQRDERDVVVPAAERAPLEVLEAERVLELAVILLDAPAQLGQAHEILERRLRGQVGQPVLDRLGRVIPRLTATEARIVAFLAVLLLVSLGVGLAAGLVTDAIRHVPLAGGVNRLGGLLAGAALALLGIWLITACLLLLPAAQLPFTASVHHSETARLLRSVPPQWSRSLRVQLEHIGTAHLKL